MSEFSKLVHAARRRQNISIKQLVEATGIHYTNVSKLECGLAPPPMKRGNKNVIKYWYNLLFPDRSFPIARFYAMAWVAARMLPEGFDQDTEEKLIEVLQEWIEYDTKG